MGGYYALTPPDRFTLCIESNVKNSLTLGLANLRKHVYRHGLSSKNGSKLAVVNYLTAGNGKLDFSKERLHRNARFLITRCFFLPEDLVFVFLIMLIINTSGFDFSSFLIHFIEMVKCSR